MPNLVEQRKVISQQTFDAAVQENEQEFEMDHEEAVRSAREQFELMGVDLSNIKLDKNKLATTEEEGAEQHPVIESCMELSQLSAQQEQNDDVLSNAIALLKDITEHVKNDKKAALIAAENGALTSISNVLESSSVQEAPGQVSEIVQHLGYICSKHEGVRRLVTESTKEVLVALSSHKDNVARNRSIVAASWIATRNEEARIFFHNNNVGWNSLKAAYDNLDDSNTIRAACQLIRALVAKDDPQADNPKAFDHARDYMASEDFDIHKLIIQVGNELVNDEQAVVELAQLVKSLAVNDEICKALRDSGVANALLRWHTAFPEESKRAHAVFAAVRKLCHSDYLKRWLVLDETYPLRTIVEAMERFQENSSVLHQAIGCIAVMALRQPGQSITFYQMNGIPLITRAMKKFPEAGDLQRQGCLAIRNLVVRNEDTLRDVFLEEQVELLLRTARKTHPQCDDVAYAALRDLHLPL